ncbi:MAG: PhzF family phenazine biosynthesis protein [Eubacterium sp.]|nr:PhzF family phenazine biosynthesis protein [Eubacterium sp.]
MNQVVKVYAFANQAGEGNPAGVRVLCSGDEMSDRQMQEIATRLGYSETAFVNMQNDKTVAIRYFTPSSEIEMCGHATIASFWLLRKKGLIVDGDYCLKTQQDEWRIRVQKDLIWIDFGHPKVEESVDTILRKHLCSAYQIGEEELDEKYPAKIVRAGIKDLHLFVRSHDVLMKAVQDEKKVMQLSKQCEVVGVHMSYVKKDKQAVQVYNSNFAPLYGIEEECATGTANAGMTAYLYEAGVIAPKEEIDIIQGEHMGRVGRLKSYVYLDEKKQMHVMIGGNAIMQEV